MIKSMHMIMKRLFYNYNFAWPQEFKVTINHIANRAYTNEILV